MKRWTVEQVEYLRANYGKIRASEIAETLGFSERKVIGKASLLKLVSNIHRFPSSTLIKLNKSSVKCLEKFNTTHDKIKFSCPYCNSEFISTPDKVARGHTKSCGCIHPNARLGTKNISMTFYKRCMRNAITRGIKWNISILDLENLFNSQSGKCALSGVLLEAGYSKGVSISIDRIDSNRPYEIDNIQLVDKNINIAKNTMSNEQFITMCSNVYKNQKDKNGY